MTAEHRYSDLGNARRLVADHGTELRHVGAWPGWLIWDGRRFRRDNRGEIIERAKQVTARLWQEVNEQPTSDERKSAARWALQSESAQRIEAMVRLARTEAGIAVDPDDLDADPWVLNVANGVVDLRTGQLLSHDPKRLITMLADVDYDPAAGAPRWQAFLEQIQPDPALREFVQRFAGYCLTGDVSEHKVLFSWGAGGNGKSVMWNSLARILGDYASAAAPDLIMRRDHEAHPTALADLQGARLVLASETAQGRSLDEALLKRLTGGDVIRARRMHADWYEFTPSHKLVVSTNHRPEIRGTDHGIWRRIRLLPFEVVIPDEEQDRHLDEKLAAEAPGILRWALDGLARWRTTGLTEPAAVIAATADYRAESDALGEFISDCCFLADGISARAADLYGAYQRWAEAMGEHPLTQRRFGLSLRERGLTKRTSNGVWWTGIGLRSHDMERSEPSSRRETAGQQRLGGAMEPTEPGSEK